MLRKAKRQQQLHTCRRIWINQVHANLVSPASADAVNQPGGPGLLLQSCLVTYL